MTNRIVKTKLGNIEFSFKLKLVAFKDYIDSIKAEVFNSDTEVYNWLKFNGELQDVTVKLGDGGILKQWFSASGNLKRMEITTEWNGMLVHEVQRGKAALARINLQQIIINIF